MTSCGSRNASNFLAVNCQCVGLVFKISFSLWHPQGSCKQCSGNDYALILALATVSMITSKVMDIFDNEAEQQQIRAHTYNTSRNPGILVTRCYIHIYSNCCSYLALMLYSFSCDTNLFLINIWMIIHFIYF